MKSNNLPTQQQRQPASPDEKISDANRLEDDANVRFLNDYPWQPEYRYRQFFFKECAVAGLSFHLEKNDDLWFELDEGTKLALIRQRDTPHDPWPWHWRMITMAIRRISISTSSWATFRAPKMPR